MLDTRGDMTTTPTTTVPGPDQARLRETMRRLAEAESTEAPILSVYADVRPEAHGERPGERGHLVTVRDRLNAIERGLERQSDAARSFAEDRKKIEALLEEEDLSGLDGVAMFACARIGVWDVVRAQTEFDTQVAAGPTADLFQLARMLDDNASTVVAVIDTNTCRLFVTRRGGLVERSGLDEPNAEHSRHDTGGWAQARFQRHIDMQDRRFAKEAAEAIERLVRREKPEHVLLAGDERVIPILEAELSEVVRPLVEHVARIDMRARPDEVHDDVAPILSALEEADDAEVADRVISGVRSGGLGVAGLDETMAALEAGQVDELVIDEAADVDDDLRAELIRQASVTDARVTVVRDHHELQRFDGVGATLRFRT